MGFANRGALGEKKVKEYLEEWQAACVFREFSRLTDTKAAGRIIKAAKADFEYFTDEYQLRIHGLIEVKETEHEYRLGRERLTQLAHLRKREKCGGRSVVVVYHSTLKRWRAVGIPYLASEGDKGSWNLTAFPSFQTVAEALHNALPEAF